MLGPTRRLAGRATAQLFAQTPSTTPSEIAQPLVQASNSRWLDDMHSQLTELKAAELPYKVAARVGKKLKRIDSARLELISGHDGFVADAKTRGLDGVPVAWGDMDGMVGHVNNVQYNRWAEAGRVNWIRSFAKKAAGKEKADWLTLVSPRGVGLIISSIKTDFKFVSVNVDPPFSSSSRTGCGMEGKTEAFWQPVSYPDNISVIHRIATEVDNSSDSFILHGLVYSETHGRIAARTTEEIVVYDYLTARRTAIKPFMVQAFREMYRLQEQRQAGLRGEIDEMQQLIQSAGKDLAWKRAKAARQA